MIPQNRFWAALPGLVFDGVQYTRGLTGSEGGATPVAADGAQTTGLSDEVPDYGERDRLQTVLSLGCVFTPIALCFRGCGRWGVIIIIEAGEEGEGEEGEAVAGGFGQE